MLFAAPPHVHGVGTLQLVLEENSLSVELRLPAINVVGFEHAPNDAQQKAAVQNAVALLKDSGQVLILPDKAQCKIESAVVTSELLDHEGHDGAHDDDHAHDSGHDHDDHDGANDDDHDGRDHAHADFDVSYGFDCRHPTALKQITLRLFQQLPGRTARCRHGDHHGANTSAAGFRTEPHHAAMSIAAATIQTDAVPAIAIDGLRFRWRPDRPWVLDIPIFSLAAGERLFLAGPSGSGKSTLLTLIVGIHLATEGHITVLGVDLATLQSSPRPFSGGSTGVIFQMFNLLPYLSVLENVMLPCQFSATRRARACTTAGSVPAEARRLLAHLGLDDPGLERRAAAELSVGQQQRVAAARALIGRPALIVADEPTSALDTDRRLDFIELLRQECRSAGTALLFVSHDRSLASHFDRVVELSTLNAMPLAGEPWPS